MRLTSLDFLRAMGAIFIVVSHSHGLIRKRFEALGYNDHFWQVEQGYTKIFGAMGVGLFLVLSGFFAFYTTWNKSNNGLDFIKKRVIRIYPTWWFALFCVICLSLVPGSSASYSAYQIFNSILLNPIYIDGDIKPILEIGWTLHYIVFYYAVIALLMLFNISSLKILSLLTVLFIFLSLIGLLIDFKTPILAVITNPRTLSFALGGWLAFFVITKKEGLAWIPAYTYITLSLLLAFIIAFVFIDAWRLNMPTLISRSSIAVLIIALFVFHPRLKNIRYGKFFKVIGEASYSIYLFHMFPLMVLSGLWKRGILLPPSSISPVITWAVIIALGVVGGVVAHYIFEKPVFNLLKNKLITKSLNNKDVTKAI
ncbi:acyltransferase [Pseudoalteromonas agarivorans]|uniref:acyltransferase family protein n=1 Tax=Pseudoalteromonas TaxID=53246 RepID=UPI000F762B34|nr:MULTISPECIES: acyltransferase [Pseudoalteromonas]AZN32436.1 acyltransferase [Pseudoalteromonas sp. Xi13]MCQ8819310.1 acyltransferase [Pseudoalteromonas agarivorans]